MQTIGIIGGGQLGRMLTLAAKPLGFKVVVLNPTAGSPAAQVGAHEIVADLYDAAALRKLAEQADFITIEIEHLDADALDEIAKLGKPVNPAPETIKMIQDKYLQKQTLQAANIAVAPFAAIDNMEQARTVLERFGGKMLVKTRLGAYDGRGNVVVSSPDELETAMQTFPGQSLYAEQFVPFVCELAIMVARSMNGEIALYPVTQTVHERNICVQTLTPAPVDDEVREQAEQIAQQVATLLDGAGMFGIELFLTAEGQVLVNEIAPRVHNSGHYTMNACRTSQFEQHIRAITGLPLGSTELLVPAIVMVNILGERDGPTELSGLANALADTGVSVHLYDKSPTKIDRKMGHINATAATLELAKANAEQARSKLNV